ncbi:MAG: hypothetical protein UGF89_12810 [Acutalibacteraceae bacterium]|nr:hypothetical protein [Acutalibacteraceae bacterium]
MENIEKLKNSMCQFISFGALTQGITDVEAFEKALYFFKYIAKQDVISGKKIVVENTNWFWLIENKANRDVLIEYIKAVKSFDSSDPVYKMIIKRFETGDSFGILGFVPRDTTEGLNKQLFLKAIEHYHLELHKKKYEVLHYKLIKCYQRNAPLSEVNSWALYEVLVRIPINYYEYKFLDTLVYGDPKELKNIYLSEEYIDLIRQMRVALRSHRDNLGSKAESLCDEIVTDYKKNKISGDFSAASHFLNELYDLYELPEGALAELKESYQYDLFFRLDKIPLEARYDINKWEVENKK